MFEVWKSLRSFCGADDWMIFKRGEGGVRKVSNLATFIHVQCYMI